METAMRDTITVSLPSKVRTEVDAFAEQHGLGRSPARVTSVGTAFHAEVAEETERTQRNHVSVLCVLSFISASSA
jgi:metal-responsive CopG/Arc/MetJ family transcriptional regulator